MQKLSDGMLLYHGSYMVVDEISLETGEDSMAILPKFIVSKTAEML